MPHSVHTSQLFGASFSTHLSTVWSLIQYTLIISLEPHSIYTCQFFRASFSIHLSVLQSLIHYTPLSSSEPHSVYTSQFFRASFSIHLSVLQSLIQYTPLSSSEPHSVYTSQFFRASFSTYLWLTILFSMLTNHWSDIRPHVRRAVSLVIADGPIIPGKLTSFCFLIICENSV